MTTTTLFVGGEDVDFAIVGSPTISTTAGTFRSAHARCTLSVSGTTVDPPTNYLPTGTWPSAQTSFWAHCQAYTTSATTANNAQWLRFLDSAGVCRLAIRGTGTTGQLKLSTRNAAGTFTDLATSAAGAFPNAVLSAIDVFVNYGTSGTFTLYVNGISVLSFSGDITTDGGGQSFQSAQISQFQASVLSPAMSEFLFSTLDTRGKAVCLLNSSTAGATQSWTGTASNVNVNTINDANFIYSATAAQIQEYKPAALPAGSWTVEAVAMSARALKGASGPSKMDFVTRIATTEYLSADYALTTSFANYASYVQEVNPATSIAFTVADLASTNFQYGLKSIT